MAVGAPYVESGRLLSTESHLAPLAASMVQASFMAAKDLAEQQRKGEAESRLDAYEDDFRGVLRARISATYSKANADDLIKVLDSTNNPLKRIVNEVSVLYARPPVWKFQDKAAVEPWREVMEKGSASVVFPRLNRMVNLLNDVLVYVRPCRDGLAFKLVLPQDVTVWPDQDDPTMPLAAMFRELDPAAPSAKPTYHLWDRREGSAGYRMFDAELREVRGEARPNPYMDEAGRQIIPMVAYHRDWPTWSFWDQTSGDDLYELTLMVGMWETWINHLIRTDSIRQKYVTGDLDSTGDQEGGTTSLLRLRSVLGQPVSVGEFSSQSDWNGLGGQIKRKLENVLYNYGLVLPDTRTSGDPTSGFALTVRSQGLAKIQKAQIPSYRKSDLAFYRVVSAVWNFERANPKSEIPGDSPELPPPSVAKPEVEYAEIDATRTVEEHVAAFALAKERMALGLESPITIYLQDHPEATEEEARQAIKKNRKDTDALEPKPEPMPMVPGRPPMPGQPVPPEQEEPAKEE